MTRDREAGRLRGRGPGGARRRPTDPAALATAYRLLVQAEAQAPGGAAELASARDALIAQAAAEEAAGRPLEATARWDALVAVEPGVHGAGRAAHLARRAQAARERGAAAAARGAIGPAFLAFALATDLEGQPADAERRDALRQQVLASARLGLDVEVEAAAPARLGAPLDALGGPTTPGGPRLQVTLQAGPMRCDQQEHATVATGTYVAGVRVEENPDWRQATEEAWRLRGDLRSAEADEERARHDLRELEERLHRQGEQVRERRRREREDGRRQLDRARDEERRAYDELQRARDRGDRQAAQRCEGDLDRTRRDVARAWQRLDTLRDDDDRMGRERDDAADRWRRLRDEAQRRRDRLTDAERRLEGVPPTREVPRHATHRYAIHHWTRTCQQEARLRLRLGAEAPTEVPLAGRAETRDDAHAVQVPLGLDADPLAFPVDDARLADRARDDVAQAAARVVADQQRAWAARLAAKAQATGDEAEAARLAAAALLLDPASRPAALLTLLRDRFELADAAPLLAGAASSNN
ncbi:MAG: hypothetical protein H6706_06005 [Myxococcales bacterium]|nr:hypothetical protein [Myxococcales bacterium]